MSREEYVRKFVVSELQEFAKFLIKNGISLFDRTHQTIDESDVDKIINEFIHSR